jgi:hypothetical protein
VPVPAQESGQVPVGQLELPEEPSPERAEKVEKIFSVLAEPHFSQVCFPRLSAFSRKDVTCPHSRHWYS